jgi:hypothetical protein
MSALRVAGVDLARVFTDKFMIVSGAAPQAEEYRTFRISALCQ